MNLSKRSFALMLCLLVLAGVALAASAPGKRFSAPYRSMRSAQAQSVQSLPSWGSGSKTKTPLPSPFRRAASNAPANGVPPWTVPAYQLSQLVSGFSNPAGIGVGTLGDWVLINSFEYGDLYGYKDDSLHYIGTPSDQLAGGKMWGHYYFGDTYGNLFRLETDLQISYVGGWDEPGLEVGGMAIDHATGLIYFIINYYQEYPDFWSADLWRYNPASGNDPVPLISLEYEQSYGLAVKGNWIYETVSSEDVIIKVNKRRGAIKDFVAGLQYPGDLDFDKAGNLYVTENEGGTVAVIKSGTTRVRRIAGGFYGPVCIGLDKAGDIFFDDNGGNLWKLIKR
jgi:hypothetical protein